MIRKLAVALILATLRPTDEAFSFAGKDCCSSTIRGGIGGGAAFALPLSGNGRRQGHSTQIPSPSCGSFALGGSMAHPLFLRHREEAAARARLSPVTAVGASGGEKGAGGGNLERASRGKEAKKSV